MNKNPLFEIGKYGQSIWFDTLSRELAASGGLQKLIDDYAVVGVTSNPTIFQKAISGSQDYDQDIRHLAEKGQTSAQIFEKLETDDVRMACDVLAPVYERTEGVDGRVSIEVSPQLAFKTQETMQDARRLWKTVDRPNLMVKIPGTHEGIPAIEQMLYEGLSINITLLFAVSMYEKVMEAYLKAMERRATDGKPLDGIHSVASFFVSRVDTMVDKELQARLSATSSPAEQARLKGLLGKAANANAKQAYQAFLRVFNGPRWEALKSKGANLQRPLWASTSTKNPAYSDTMYVSELIGQHTVNTMPEETMLAFADHGEVRGLTVEEDLQGVRQALKELGEVGIDMEDITGRRLVDEGVQKFADSYKVLLDELRKKRDTVVTR